MNIQIANRLYEYRKKNNLSQEQLAAQIGVSRQAVSKWERAEASPDTDNLILLSKIYSVSLDELLFTDEPVTDELVENLVEEFPDTTEKASTTIVSKGAENPNIRLDKGEDVENRSYVQEEEAIKGKQILISDKQVEDEKAEFWLNFPYPIVVVIVYLILGFGLKLWHPAWILFLTIPIYYGSFGVKNQRKRDQNSPR